MKKVVLMGDSIRLSYQERVRELLADVADVVWPKQNGAYTMDTIWAVRDWFRDNGWGPVDLIHWNNGIWEHHRTLDDGEPLTTPEEYLYLNRRLHRQLKRYTDNLIWATTTPAGLCYKYNKDGRDAVSRDEWNRENELYNALVSAYLTEQGVEIDDLWALMNEHLDYICEDGFHLNPAGVEAAANQVAACIRAKLLRN